MNESKVCTGCGSTKPIADYPFRAKSGKHESQCKACKAAYAKAYHAKWRAKPENKARANQRSAQWRLDNIERERELNRKWRLENRDVKRATNKAWYENVGRGRITPEKRQEANARWRGNNPERFAELNRLNVKRRRARMKQAQVLPFTPEQLAARIAFYGGMCWMCRTSPFEHLDHVKPVSKGGAHMLSNLRPACAECNLSKKDKWPLEVA